MLGLLRVFILPFVVVLGYSEQPQYVPKDGPFGLAMGMGAVLTFRLA